VCGALEGLTAAWGLPLGDPSVLAVHALARRAAGDGIRVLLSGEGADELLLGYARHRAARWLPCARPVRRLLPRGGWSMARGRRLLRAAAARDPYAALLGVTPPSFRRAVLARELQDAALPEVREREPLARARAVDLAFYLRWDLLPKLDVATMAAGLEGRCPFLDPAVVAAAQAMRPRQVLGKAPLRRAFARHLPAAAQRLPKTGFALPLDRWFRGDLPWLDLLRERRTRERPHVRGPGLGAAIDRHRRGAADLGHALYLVVAFELWLRAQEASACG
jgi:asparagine synthase (glutamine-hydrolysing)